MADTSKAETKGINLQLDKTFKKGLKIGKKGGKVKQAYLGSFIEGGPGSNATYRKYYKGMV